MKSANQYISLPVILQLALSGHISKVTLILQVALSGHISKVTLIL
jgi:hypothetical protein